MLDLVLLDSALLVLLDVNENAEDGLDLLDVEVEVVLTGLVLDDVDVELIEAELNVEVLDVNELLEVLLVLLDVKDGREEGLDLLEVEVEVVLSDLVLEDVDVEVDVLME